MNFLLLSSIADDGVKNNIVDLGPFKGNMAWGI